MKVSVIQKLKVDDRIHAPGPGIMGVRQRLLWTVDEVSGLLAPGLAGPVASAKPSGLVSGPQVVGGEDLQGHFSRSPGPAMGHIRQRPWTVFPEIRPLKTFDQPWPPSLLCPYHQSSAPTCRIKYCPPSLHFHRPVRSPVTGGATGGGGAAAAP